MCQIAFANLVGMIRASEELSPWNSGVLKWETNLLWIV